MPSFRRALRWVLVLALALVPIMWLVLSWPYLSLTTGGVWRARIVDAETSGPLAGVVVHLSWDRCHPTLGGWAGCTSHDAEEAVTGADGRFALRLRWTYEIPLVVRVSGPEIMIFKPGYGQWRHRGPGGGELSAVTLLELPPLTTRDERLAMLRSLSRAGLVPGERAARLHAAIDAERGALGLGRR